MRPATRIGGCSLALLFFVGVGLALDYDIIFRGSDGNRTIIAISVKDTPTPEELDQAVARIEPKDDALVLVYRGHLGASRVAPMAVYEAGTRTLLDENPESETKGPTIAVKISRAYRSGGRTGAVCRDGTRSSATGRGACSHHRGVARWLHSRIKDTGAVVASICTDLRLVAGKKCGSSGVMARILNREYE